MHETWFRSLRFGEQCRVERGLEHRPRLGRSRELGVNNFVVQRTFGAGVFVGRREHAGSDEEVGPPVEGRLFCALVSQQHRLEDDVDSALDCFERGLPRVLSGQVWNLGDRSAHATEPIEHLCFVRFTPGDDVLEAEVEALRWLDMTSGAQEIEMAQVPAGEKVRDVARGEPDVSGLDPHGAFMLLRLGLWLRTGVPRHTASSSSCLLASASCPQA